MILTAPPPDNWKTVPRHPCITWLNTVQRDFRAYNLTLNEAVDLAQNRPMWVEAVYVWRYALLVVRARKEVASFVTAKAMAVVWHCHVYVCVLYSGACIWRWSWQAEVQDVWIPGPACTRATAAPHRRSRRWAGATDTMPMLQFYVLFRRWSQRTLQGMPLTCAFSS